MRVATRLLVLVALLAPAAGCLTGSAEESDAGSPTPSASPRPATRFAIEGLRIVAASGHEGPLREDDVALVQYTVRNEGDVRASQFVSLLIDGKVAKADSLQLRGGEERRFEHRIAPLHDVDVIDVQVRAGDRSATATAEVALWPRVKGTADLGVETVRVERWTRNETRGGIDVNLTIKRPEGPPAPDPNLRATLLCLAAEDRPEPLREAFVLSPRPGERASLDVPYPTCDDPYGLELRLTDPSGRERYARILFVSDNWRPTASRDA